MSGVPQVPASAGYRYYLPSFVTAQYRRGAPCVCGHTIEQHGVQRCEAQDVICGCVRFRLEAAS